MTDSTGKKYDCHIPIEQDGEQDGSGSNTVVGAEEVVGNNEKELDTEERIIELTNQIVTEQAKLALQRQVKEKAAVNVLLNLEFPTCIIQTKDFWTYEVCPHQSVKQYHLEEDGTKSPIFQLGKYDPMKAMYYYNYPHFQDREFRVRGFCCVGVVLCCVCFEVISQHSKFFVEP